MDFEAVAKEFRLDWEDTVTDVQGNMVAKKYLLAAHAAGKVEGLEEAANEIPSNWIDPILTGDNSIGKVADCRDIEKFAARVKKRIKAKAAELRGK